MNSRFFLRRAVGRLIWLGVGFVAGLMVAGRYSMVSPHLERPYVYVIDQLTGRMWRAAGASWQALQPAADPSEPVDKR